METCPEVVLVCIPFQTNDKKKSKIKENGNNRLCKIEHVID